MSQKIENLNAEIETLKPYAKKCVEMGINPNTNTNPLFQGFADRAKRFCEAVSLRDFLEAQE